MNIARVFDNMKQWVNDLDIHQIEILNKLMDMTDTSHFIDIPADEILHIQEHMFLSMNDEKRRVHMYDILRGLKPRVFDADFI